MILGTRRYQEVVVLDRLGSVVRGENVSGSLTSYYPYGEQKGADNLLPEKFATYLRDSIYTGLDYAHNRYYASSLGRFLTPDPYGGSARLGNPGGWNRYAYVGDDPINTNDPLGLCTFNININNLARLSDQELGALKREVERIFQAAGQKVVFGNKRHAG